MLVIQRGPGSMLPGYWSPPSGRIEAGEPQPDAVIREMQEEGATDDDLLALARVAEDGGVITPAPDEVAAWRWFDAATFLALPPEQTFGGDRVFFRSVLPAL